VEALARLLDPEMGFGSTIRDTGRFLSELEQHSIQQDVVTAVEEVESESMRQTTPFPEN
jgi:hypothetical protein